MPVFSTTSSVRELQSRFAQFACRLDVPFLSIVQLVALMSCLVSCDNKSTQASQPVYQDVAFQQDFSIKYELTDTTVELLRVAADRNGAIQILSSGGSF